MFTHNLRAILCDRPAHRFIHKYPNLESHSAIFSIYRKYLRQIRRLPQNFLQEFFKIKVRDDTRSIQKSTVDRVRRAKLKRYSKDLRKLEAANQGDAKAFDHILDLAYGRKGKLKWEIMRPLLSDPNAPFPEPIIPANPKSRPPVYSPELTALITSCHSRPKKPLNRDSLSSPPTLPPRADPSSEEARLFGPLSKRRRVNILWRFFTEEWKKVLPPLQVCLTEGQPVSDALSGKTDQESLHRAGIRGVGLQHPGILEDIEGLAGPVPTERTLTRRQRRTEIGAPSTSAPSHSSPETKLSRRWLRRRYRLLLARLPVLTYTPPGQHNGRSSSGKYVVRLSDKAIVPSLRFDGKLQPELDDADMTWLKQAEIKDKREDQRT